MVEINVKNYELDMGGYKPRKIDGVKVPESMDSLLTIVEEAYRNATPLYPISSGKNWGFGSKKPNLDHCTIVDLQKLNQIRELNLEKGYAVIEAGVTQEQLYAALQGTSWMANFTHSCATTSIIGNSLEKGVGNFRQRTQDIIGFEAVTGEGKLLRCGSYWEKMDSGFFYDLTTGPSLHELFYQSNFGVVTAAIFKLIPKPSCMKLMELRFSHSDFAATMDQLQQVYKHELINSVFKIYNASAHKNYGYKDISDNDELSYVGYGVFYGMESVINAQIQAAENLMASAGTSVKTHVYTYNNNGQLINASIDSTLEQLNAGIPTRKAVASISDKGDLDFYAEQGWVLFAPVVPFTGKDMLKAIDIYRNKEKQHGIEVNTTFNVLSENAIDLVTSIRFDRDNLEQRNTVHQVLGELYEEFNALNYYAYRADIDHQQKDVLYADHAYYAQLQRIKHAFDPKGIISPGRYAIEVESMP